MGAGTRLLAAFLGSRSLNPKRKFLSFRVGTRGALLMAKFTIGKYILAQLLGFTLLAVPAVAQNVIAIFPNPTFYTCKVPPAPPPNAPASVGGLLASMSARCGQPEHSGRMQMIRFVAPPGAAIPPGSTAIQNISLAGTEGRTEATSVACADKVYPVALRFTEYFRVPVNDFHLYATCCEEKWNHTVKASVAFLPVPAGAQPIPPGEQANFAATTAAQAAAINTQVSQGSTLLWGYKSEYDGCDPNAPATSCGSTHCMQNWSRSRNPNPPAGSSGLGALVSTNYAESGQ